MKPSIVIRRGRPEDIPNVMQLILELAQYEKALAEVEINAEQLLKDGFGANPLYYLWVAENLDTKLLVGCALCYTRYSTWKGKRLYLEDIIVTQHFRNQGIGKQLLEHVFHFALENQFNGVTWQVLEWNYSAIAFYQKYNVRKDSSWVNYEITKAELLKLFPIK
ncbi:MAG: GNAT family N-acetyltransferase [Bacteroidia bacterium]|nr:GNAT family N-acetyltransferase [Bacteroidia bacterium]MDW8157492.1 GNAT family N-acetyltransferase [Bacteroidia bacterium]